MITKNEIKYLRSLHQRKNRQIHQQFLAEGIKVVEDLLQAEYPILTLYSTSEWIPTPKAAQQQIPHYIVTARELDQISTLKSPNQVVALCKSSTTTTINPSYFDDVIIFLDSIRDPGNLGTIIRTADWFGIKNIVCTTDTVEIYNPKVVQSTMGSIARIHVTYIDSIDFFSQVPSTIPVYGLFLIANKNIEIITNKPSIIIIGSESHGISHEVESYITEKISIPPYLADNNHAESLNAAVAGALAMYQVRNN